MTRDFRIRACLLAAGLAAAASLSACGDGDGLSAAVTSASNTLTALTGSGTAAAPAAVRETKYAAVIQDLQSKLASGGEPATVASANLLLAQATAGQAELIAQRAREADGRLAAALIEARAMLTLCLEQRALASSREGYDPSASIAGFEAQSNERSNEIAALTADLEQNQAAVKTLHEQAAAQAARAAGKREEERSILKGSEGLGASARLSEAERAAAVRREGDAFERRAAEIEAEAARIAPHSDEIRREIRRAQSQKDSLAKAKQSLLDLKTFTDEQVAGARQGARRAEAALIEAAGKVEALLNEEVKPRYDEAASKYGAASSKAAAARTGGSRQAVAVTSGTIQHALAALHRERAQALARAAAFFGEIAAATPPIADAERFASAAKSLSEESRQALAAAAESYATASGSFQGAGAESYTRLAEHLAATEKQLKGEPPEPPAEEAPNEAPAEHQDEAPASDAPSDPAPEQPAEGAAPGR